MSDDSTRGRTQTSGTTRNTRTRTHVRTCAREAPEDSDVAALVEMDNIAAEFADAEYPDWEAYKRASRMMSYAVIEAAFDEVFCKPEDEFPQLVRAELEKYLQARVPFQRAWASVMHDIPFPPGWSRKGRGTRAYRNVERPTSPLEFLEDCMRKAYEENLEQRSKK